MKTRIAYAVMLSALICGLCRSAPKSLAIQVPVQAIMNGDVVLIGRTGLPLKTVMNVEGVWEDEYRGQPEVVLKDDNLRWSFRVTHINGKLQTQDLRFGKYDVRTDDRDRQSIKVNHGEQWKVQAFEALEDYHFNVFGPPVQTSRHGYTPTLWYESSRTGTGSSRVK